MKLYKNHINVYDIIENEEYLYLKVLKDDYEKIKKNIVSAKFYYVDDAGVFHLKKVITPLVIFCALIFLFAVNFFSQVIVDVSVIHSNKEIRNLVSKAIHEYGVKVWSVKKDYKEIQNIKNEILNKYKDKLEWLEIENIGMKYIVRIEERIINNNVIENKFCNVVASKSGIISSIKSTKGEVLVRNGEYVTEGKSLISGQIVYNGEVKNNVCASGEVYAEVWYQTHVSFPINYTINKRTGNMRYNLAIETDSGVYKIFKSRLTNYETDSKVLFRFFNFTFYKLNEYEVNIEENTYNLDTGEQKALDLSLEKLKMKLSNSEIKMQKVLKKSINDSIMSVEIFYSVLENIAKTEEYFVTTE